MILHHDNDWVFVDKPVGMATHAGKPGELGAVEWLALHLGLETHVVSRLDRGTSGVLLLALFGILALFRMPMQLTPEVQTPTSAEDLVRAELEQRNGAAFALALPELPAGAFNFRLIEPEFAFRLGRDLSARAEPYDEAAVAEAVASLHPAIEVVTSAFDQWHGQGVASLIADDDSRGASLGVFASAQFLGAFVGGLIGGRFLAAGRPSDVFFVCCLLAGIWLALQSFGRFRSS